MDLCACCLAFRFRRVSGNGCCCDPSTSNEYDEKNPHFLAPRVLAMTTSLNWHGLWLISMT